MDFSPLHDILRNFFYFIKLFLLFVTVNRLLINRFYIKIVEHTFRMLAKAKKQKINRRCLHDNKFQKKQA